MSTKEREVTEKLTRIETKLDNLNSALMKIVYALIGIIAATVGIQFKPNSPINWAADTNTATAFLAIIVGVFLAFSILKAYKANRLHNGNPKWLCAGLLLWAIALAVGSFNLMGLFDVTTFFFLITPFRLGYIISWAIYAYKV